MLECWLARIRSISHSKCTDSAEQPYSSRSARITALAALPYYILSVQFYYSVQLVFKLVWVSNEQFQEGNLV